MPGASKIATCCYCGTRAALVLRGDSRHELSCSSCGAPLHELKSIPLQKQRVEREVAYRSASAKAQRKTAEKPRKKLKNKRKFAKKIFEEAFDFIEDIFD
ncbi:hypothetical protein BXY66_2108 [Shimia isoporae]|uniref:Uncharacterized protein n=1 Tax=Shimia isoporae TaxID=647720 RepID=A0A4V2Q470_9RHOB|nr:hypothetical protein [Shimia isoporae]TCL10040.1 hypothetical protein BXY66_2108 [Shimia isoporae]